MTAHDKDGGTVFAGAFKNFWLGAACPAAGAFRSVSAARICAGTV